MPQILSSILGIVAILAIAFVLSVGRKRIRLRLVGAAFGLQALMAFLVLATSWGRAVLQGMSDGVAALLSHANAGTAFLFGARSEEHTSALQSLMRISYAVFCLKKKHTK